jgi:hypothetical protein
MPNSISESSGTLDDTRCAEETMRPPAGSSATGAVRAALPVFLAIFPPKNINDLLTIYSINLILTTTLPRTGYFMANQRHNVATSTHFEETK